MARAPDSCNEGREICPLAALCGRFVRVSCKLYSLRPSSAGRAGRAGRATRDGQRPGQSRMLSSYM